MRRAPCIHNDYATQEAKRGLPEGHSKLVRHLGLPVHDWFGARLVFTTAGASLACAVMTFPVMVRAIRLSLESIDPGLDQFSKNNFLAFNWYLRN